MKWILRLAQNSQRLLLVVFFLLGSITALDVYNKVTDSTLETSVQGIQVETSGVQDAPSSTVPTSTPPSSTNKPQTTIQAKQYGGWYWQQELGRAQRWMGTDAQGNDIWNDLIVVQVLGASTSGGNNSQTQTQAATTTSSFSSTSSSTNDPQSTPSPTTAPTPTLPPSELGGTVGTVSSAQVRSNIVN